MDALGFLDSICITVFMLLCDIVGISDRLADHDSLSTQRYFQGKQLSRVVTLVLDPDVAIKAYKGPTVLSGVASRLSVRDDMKADCQGCVLHVHATSV